MKIVPMFDGAIGVLLFIDGDSLGLKITLCDIAPYRRDTARRL